MEAVTEVSCDRIEDCGGGFRAITLRILRTGSALASLQPGLHVALRYPIEAEFKQQRRYTVTRKPSADLLEISVRRNGGGGVADRLHDDLRPGAALGLLDAAGEITVDSISAFSSVGMIAGGAGVTLPLALLRELDRRRRSAMQGPDVVLLLCVPKISDIAFLHELLTLELSTSWFRMHVFITREIIRESDRFHHGRPDRRQLDCLGEPHALVVCGSHSLATELGNMAADRFPHAKLLIEAFTPPLWARENDTMDSAADCGQLYVADLGCHFSLRRGKSLLETLDENEVAIKSQCRSGICGACRIRIHSGKVRRETDFCLSQHEKESGYALACCTYPLEGDVHASLKP